MTYKHKMHAVDSDGKIVSSADFDFYIVEVMLYNVRYSFCSTCHLFMVLGIPLFMLFGQFLITILIFDHT